MATATAAVAAIATAIAAVTTINSKEAVTAAAEESDDGLDGQRLCSVIFVIQIFLTVITTDTECQGNREISSLEVHPRLVVLL